MNVEQLHSDNNLRDAKIRADNLDSHDYPLAYLTVSRLDGMPTTLTPGEPIHFKLESQLTVKKTPGAGDAGTSPLRSTMASSPRPRRPR